MFVIGGAVNGGVYGNHPNIDESALDDEGNTVYSQDAEPVPLDRHPRRLRHHPEALAQHAAADDL